MSVTAFFTPAINHICSTHAKRTVLLGRAGKWLRKNL